MQNRAGPRENASGRGNILQYWYPCMGVWVWEEVDGQWKTRAVEGSEMPGWSDVGAEGVAVG